MSAAKILTPEPVLPIAPLIKEIAYGPFSHERFGSALGVNLLGSGSKLCSFNCGYCNLGATTVRLNRLKNDIPFPSVQEISDAIGQSFKQIHDHGPVMDSIVISGNGEPTLHPEFNLAVDAILAARDLWMPGKPILLFTNGATLDTRKVSDAANRLDERIVKLDAGNEKTFKAINAPLSRANLAKVLTGLRHLDTFIAQSFFVQGEIDNTRASDVDDWIEVIAMLKPKAVWIQGLTHQGAISGLQPCSEDTLYTIASKLERRTGIRGLVNL